MGLDTIFLEHQFCWPHHNKDEMHLPYKGRIKDNFSLREYPLTIDFQLSAPLVAKVNASLNLFLKIAKRHRYSGYFIIGLFPPDCGDSRMFHWNVDNRLQESCKTPEQSCV
jgi:hypothetical protein